MQYLNIDAMGTVHNYPTSDQALSMSSRLPFAWKAIALPVGPGHALETVLQPMEIASNQSSVDGERS